MNSDTDTWFNWQKLLAVILKDIGINIYTVFALGHCDLEWISDKVYQEGWLYWANTFLSFSIMAKLAEFDTKIWTNLALFGGRL